MLKNKKGFSLVEILIACVVIIILGVLSIQIQSYQAEKSRVIHAVDLMRKILDAEIAYRLENKHWCFSFDELPMEIGVELDNSELGYGRTKETARRTEDFVFILASSGADNAVVQPESSTHPNMAVIVKRCYPGEKYDEEADRGYTLYWDMNTEFRKRFHFDLGTGNATGTHKWLALAVYKFLERKYGQNYSYT